MKKQPLTAEYVKTLLDYDPSTGVFRWILRVNNNPKGGQPSQPAGSINSSGYAQIRINKVFYKRSQLAWLVCYGKWPERPVDHINGDCSDDRIDNLREATFQQNSMNRGVNRNNSSGFKGVQFCRETGRWRSVIGKDTARHHLGYFDTAEEAASAYNKAALYLYGEFAWLNPVAVVGKISPRLPVSGLTHEEGAGIVLPRIRELEP